MSRLDRHKQQQVNKLMLFLALCVGIAIIAFFTVGLKSIINATVFLNHFSSNSTDTTGKKDEDFFGIFTIDEPATATNSAQIVITGNAADYAKIDIYLNNVKVKTLNDDLENFSAKIGTLKSGENKLRAIASDRSGKHVDESETFKVMYMNDPPRLEISSHKDGDTVHKSDLRFEGKTDSGVTLKVNKRPIVVDFQGNFKSSFTLKDGENTLEFEALDEAGNSTKKTLKIRYHKDE